MNKSEYVKYGAENIARASDKLPLSPNDRTEWREAIISAAGEARRVGSGAAKTAWMSPRTKQAYEKLQFNKHNSELTEDEVNFIAKALYEYIMLGSNDVGSWDIINGTCDDEWKNL